MVLWACLFVGCFLVFTPIFPEPLLRDGLRVTWNSVATEMDAVPALVDLNACFPWFCITHFYVS